MEEFTSSTGVLVSVKGLGIFDLDNVPKPDTKPFTYIVEFGPIKLEEEYKLELWKQPPQLPNKLLEQCEKESKEWYDWREYHLFWACVERKQQIKENISKYIYEIKKYIFENSLDDSGRENIKTKEDWLELCRLALVPQMTLEDLELIELKTFQSTYGNSSLIQVFLNLKGDDNDEKLFYNVVRDWEIKTMIACGLSEKQWGELSLDERARKIYSHHIDSWMTAIEYSKHKNKHAK